VLCLCLHLFTAVCRVLLEMLPGLQLLKKFRALSGTRLFINALTILGQPSVSRARPIQSIYPHSTSWRSILLLSTHPILGSPSGLLPSGYPPRPYTHTLTTHKPLAQLISFFSIDQPQNIGSGVQII